MSNRHCWIVLERKAHDQVRECQTQLAEHQAKMDKLQTTLDRLMGMYAEYRSEESKGGKQTGLQGAMNQRQFMSQLLSVRERIEKDMSMIQGVMAQIRTRLIKAETQRMKMQALVDQEEQTERKLQDMIDQKRMDEAAVSRYNARSAI